MSTTNLAMCFHIHQPVGNFDFVIEKAYRNSYLPLIETFSKFPSVKFSLHISGILIDWFCKHYPDYIKTLSQMAASGQLEMISGAYYEPLLPITPEQDSKEQICYMNERIEELFGQRPRGMWLTERVWEPHLCRVIAQTGLRYAFLDDSHFTGVGIKPEQTGGHFITEDQGESLHLFPISMKMRYLAPFKPVNENIDYLRAIRSAENKNNLAIFADDGEKFGDWPGTFDWVHGGGRWLLTFLEAVTENQDWLKTCTYSQALDTLPTAGKVYLPAASYHEMMNWSLTTEAQQQRTGILNRLGDSPDAEQITSSLAEGYWRNFFIKYPESNNMHKKMLYVSRQLGSAVAEYGNNPQLQAAKMLLWQGQCNCAYWHGVFGGLYLPHLRSAIYQKLIESERALNAFLQEQQKSGYRPVRVEYLDYDFDGYKEVLLSTPAYNCYFAPQLGASLLELDLLASAHNITDTLARTCEAYHQKIFEMDNAPQHKADGTTSIHDISASKESGLSKLIKYDPYRQASFIDHFLPADFRAEERLDHSYKEHGDFVMTPYSSQKATKKNILHFMRAGQISHNDTLQQVVVSKEIRPGQSGFVVKYDILNKEGHFPAVQFGVELNLTANCFREDDRRILLPSGEKFYWGDIIDLDNVSHFNLVDQWRKLNIKISSEQKFGLHAVPIQTVSQSESGFERVYQHTSFMLTWPLLGKKQDNITIEVSIEEH